MQATLEPGSISGHIAAPPSKSMTQRAYAAALLHPGTTIVRNAGTSADELAALTVIQSLGAVVVALADGAQQITSTGVVHESATLMCGESGLAARLFTPIAALCSSAITITGTGSLPGRPMEGFAAVLPQLGVGTGDFDGHLPLTVQGPLRAASINIDGSGGSQFLSGLLFAVSQAATEAVIITVADLASKPYIDMTLEVLAHFGKPIAHSNYEVFHIDPTKFSKQDTVEINITGDWSSAAAMLVAGALAGEITVDKLDTASTQADRAILTVLRAAGASVQTKETSITVKMAPLRAFEFDATHCPDLFPVLAVLAACCHGESYIAGVHRLFHKESNRAASISDLLTDFNVPFSLEDDSFCITGVRRLSGTVIDVHHDHRLVMAAALGALRARSRVDIPGAEAVHKSYPAFFQDLTLCGAKCTLA